MIQTVTETGSTNADLAARLTAGEGLAEGNWLVADRQLAGRGRQGRTWFDGAGNFMGSTVVHVGTGDPPPATLALIVGLAVAEAVAPHIPPPHHPVLKWPNDIIIGRAKLCGILLEMVRSTVIVGIGVNLAAEPELADRETVALSRYGATPDRDLFAADMARCFAAELARWRTYGLAPIISRWQALAHPVGTSLAVGEPGEVPVEGEFAGLADDGALQLRLPDGTTRTVHAGEVRLA